MPYSLDQLLDKIAEFAENERENWHHCEESDCNKRVYMVMPLDDKACVWHWCYQHYLDQFEGTVDAYDIPDPENRMYLYDALCPR